MQQAPRTSVVQQIRVIDNGYASILFIGDLKHFAPRTEALAVQREIPRFSGQEGNLKDYPIFTRPIPHLLPRVQVSMHVTNTDPAIHVGSIEVTSISTSSLVQAGELRFIQAEARVKNIREKLTAPLRKT